MMHKYLPLLTSGFVYVFAFVFLIVGLVMPYKTAEVAGVELEVYVDKVFAAGQCQSKTTTGGNSLYGLYIILIILTAVCFILYILGKYKLCCYVGIVLLLFA